MFYRRFSATNCVDVVREGPGPNQTLLGFIVAQSGHDEKEMPHGQALWSCRFVLMLSVLFRAAFLIRTFPPRGFAPI
jgi:hypothetical protein